MGAGAALVFPVVKSAGSASLPSALNPTCATSLHPSSASSEAWIDLMAESAAMYCCEARHSSAYCLEGGECVSGAEAVVDRTGQQ
jgi:hypothetical protein